MVSLSNHRAGLLPVLPRRGSRKPGGGKNSRSGLTFARADVWNPDAMPRKRPSAARPPPDELIRAGLTMVATRCPELARVCFWAGTSAIATEELHHRVSLDLDFHTRRALADVRPLLARMRAALRGRLEVVQPPDALGSAFRAVLSLPGGVRLPVEVFSSFEDVPATDLVPSSTLPGVLRVSLRRYLADKLQCVVERLEARDLYDIGAVLQHAPRLVPRAKALVARQDLALLCERLLGWTEDALRDDLAAYPGVDPAEASKLRDLLLEWARAARGRRAGP